ncbi:MAG: deoxyribodipyrimidine photo-lyase, partial [Pseudomonadota bacterium]
METCAVKTLYWARNDLRLHDNLALSRAALGSSHLDIVYTCTKSLKTAHRHRKSFVYKTLREFDHSLRGLKQKLNVCSV